MAVVLARVAPVQRPRRPSPATALAVLATVVALASALPSAPHVGPPLVVQQRVYAAYTDTQREHAPIDGLGLPSDIFDFYRQYVVPGDRVYFQVRESGFSQFLD